MYEPLFAKAREEIEKSLVVGERLRDVEALYEIIVSERRTVSDVAEVDERIALISLCFFIHPWKTPQYMEEIVGLRLSYKGIAENSQLQSHFKGRLKPILRSARSLKELKFDRLSDVFEDDDRGGGPGSSGNMPIQPVTVCLTIECESSTKAGNCGTAEAS